MGDTELIWGPWWLGQKQHNLKWRRRASFSGQRVQSKRRGCGGHLRQCRHSLGREDRSLPCSWTNACRGFRFYSGRLSSVLEQSPSQFWLVKNHMYSTEDVGLWGTWPWGWRRLKKNSEDQMLQLEGDAPSNQLHSFWWDSWLKSLEEETEAVEEVLGDCTADKAPEFGETMTWLLVFHSWEHA